MKYFEKIGFVLCLLGFGGMAEAYGFNKSFAISLTLIIAGAILIGIGDMSNDIKTYKRNNRCDSNVLDRLYFLRR